MRRICKLCIEKHKIYIHTEKSISIKLLIKQSLRKTISNKYNCVKYFYPFIFQIGVFIKDFTF